jgi:hypothetical protein
MDSNTFDSNPSFGHARKPPPFTFAAKASKGLLRGELVEFHVDEDGHVTSPQLEFIQPVTPQLLMKPPVS